MGLVDIGEAGMTVDVELQTDSVTKRRHRFMSRRAAAHHRRRARALLSSPEDSPPAAEVEEEPAAGGEPSEHSSSSSNAAHRVEQQRAAAGKSKLPSATGELILNVGNFGAWFGTQAAKAHGVLAPPAPPPPPPFVDHTHICQDVIDGRQKTKALNDFRLTNFAGHDVSDVKCNRRWRTNEWNGQVWKGVKDGVYTTDEGEEWDEPYVVHGKAGDSILSTHDMRKGDEVSGMSCGVKFPARIREFSDRKYLKPGGISMATACVASSGFKGKGNVNGSLSPTADCILELHIEVHNCLDFTLWMLPKVTLQMLRESVGKLYVKIAYINLESMDSDNMIPKCNKGTMFSRVKDDDDDDEDDDDAMEYDKLCVNEDGAMSSGHGRDYPKFRRFDSRTKSFRDDTEYGDMEADPVIEQMLKNNEKLSFPVTTGAGNKLVPDLYAENKADMIRTLVKTITGRRKLAGSKNYNTAPYKNPTEPYLECVDETGQHYEHRTDAYVTEGGNKYEAETAKRLVKGFAMWSVGIQDQIEYTYMSDQVQSLNEKYGENALPHGILGEFSRCRVWENSQDDTWLDTLDRGKPDELFVWTNIYTRTLLAHCQDAKHVSDNNPEECCITGPGGLICYYISGTPGNDVRYEVSKGAPAYQKAPHVKGNAYIERADKCEVGFCTNGRGYRGQPSPPPPPSFTMPQAPSRPGMPDMPPGQSMPESPIEPPAPILPPGAHSPPPSPPPAEPALPDVLVNRGECSPIDSPDISDAQLSSFRAACNNSNYEVLESFGVEQCLFSVDQGAPGEACMNAQHRTCAGLRDVSKCVVKQNREITPGYCKKETSLLMHLAGKRLGALLGTPVQCPYSSALLSWKFTADTRPWYTRREEPGRYSMEFTCCPAMELDVCRTKRSGCDMKTTSPMTALLRVPGPQCATALDEVLTGWKLTGEGCSGGFMRWETTCCISPTFYDSEGANNVTGTEAEDHAEAATKALESGNTKARRCRLNPVETSVESACFQSLKRAYDELLNLCFQFESAVVQQGDRCGARTGLQGGGRGAHGAACRHADNPGGCELRPPRVGQALACSGRVRRRAPAPQRPQRQVVLQATRG